MEHITASHGEKPHEAIAAREKADELPNHLYQMVRGYMPSRCILTALELDLFIAVGTAPRQSRLVRRLTRMPDCSQFVLIPS